MFFGQVPLSCHVPYLGERNGAGLENGFMCFLLLWASMQVSFLWKKKDCFFLACLYLAQETYHSGLRGWEVPFSELKEIRE